MSKRRPDRSESVAGHRHCLYCGISIRKEDEFCCADHQSEFIQLENKKKYLMASGCIIPLALIILVYLFFFM